MSIEVTDEKKIMATLALSIPGISSTINIPFHDRSLPVCQDCKFHYKTKASCREKEGHTDLPWSNTYVCITLDSTCIKDNSLISDMEFAATVTKTRNDLFFSNSVDRGIPICLICKGKNYTRPYCREKLEHRLLPYLTIYVTLTDASIAIDRHDKKSAVGNKIPHGVVYEPDDSEKTKFNNDIDGKRFFENIHESRSFLCQVSDESANLEWVCVNSAPSTPIKARERKKHKKSVDAVPEVQSSISPRVQYGPSFIPPMQAMPYTVIPQPSAISSAASYPHFPGVHYPPHLLSAMLPTHESLYRPLFHHFYPSSARGFPYSPYQLPIPTLNRRYHDRQFQRTDSILDSTPIARTDRTNGMHANAKK